MCIGLSKQSGSYPGEFFLDDLLIYSRQLSDAETLELYNETHW